MSSVDRLLGKTRTSNMNVLKDDEATALLKQGILPPNSVVDGTIRASSKGTLEIPPGLVVDVLELNNQNVKFNPGLKARCLILNEANLENGLPDDLVCEQLGAAGTNLGGIPDGVTVSERLNLTNCSELVRLPPDFKTGSLILRNCSALETLPEGLFVYFLDISGCSRIRKLPARASIHYGRLLAGNCVNLEFLPDWLENLTGLDLQNCSRIDRLPKCLTISEWLDIAGTRITSLPPHLDNVGLRWRGVPVDRRIVFHPESLTSNDILQERNAEVRRVMLERVGFERFVELSNAETLDTDRDKGGERRLLKVAMPSDEDLVCVSFSCPSTGRKYIVRVPPTIRTAQAAVAWIAGFDNPEDYEPEMES